MPADSNRKPKVFLSYAWTDEAHKETVRAWADRLLQDGIDVLLDLYDLKEGYDKYVFMERCVTDSTVSHVLIISDKAYAEKADSRKAGVGTEAQLISKEIYEKVDQSKFIPIICQFDLQGQPYLPAFIKSRIGINFSTPEKVNENWEQLVRVLYGKPRLVKPPVGSAPVYLAEDAVAPASPARAKFEDFKQALLSGRSALNLFRTAFLNACMDYADTLRVRTRPEEADQGRRVLEDCAKLVVVRDHIVDWVVLESAITSVGFSENLVDTLERLKEISSRPKEVTSWNDSWFEAQKLFVFETFLYIVAALVRTKAYAVLGTIVKTQYLRPSTERNGDRKFNDFSGFYARSDLLQSVLAPPNRKLLSPAAALVKRQAQRADITFADLIEADLILFFVALAGEEYWYPQLMFYSERYYDFPFFLRAARHKDFQAITAITGLQSGDAVRTAVKKGYDRNSVVQWHDFWPNDLLRAINLISLDTM